MDLKLTPKIENTINAAFADAAVAALWLEIQIKIGLLKK